MSKKTKTTNKLTQPYSAGLKRRSAETQEVRVVNKPRKMSLMKPRRLIADTPDFSNSSLITFPSDPLGITREVKAAMIRAGSKMGTTDQGLELMKEVVELCMKHLEARLKQNKKTPTLRQRVDTRGTGTQVAEDAVEATTEAPAASEGTSKKATKPKSSPKRKTKGKK